MSSISLSAGMKSSMMSLQSTQKLVESTQEHMTTGKKVAKPSDDPAAYYAAVTLTDRAGDLSNRLDGMGQAVQAIKAADNGIGAMRSVLSNMKAVVENALTTNESDTTTREAMGKKFNDLLVQLQSFAKDSAYGGINLLVDEQEIDVQLGQRFDESTFRVQGFHVAGISSVSEDGEVGALTKSDLPLSWKEDPTGMTGYSMGYNPYGSWIELSGVEKVEDEGSGTYTIFYASGATAGLSGIGELVERNGSYWAASNASAPVWIDYGRDVAQYAFALNKVEDQVSLVGIKSYGKDALSPSGHEIDWGSEDYREDLKVVMNSIETIDEVLKTRSTLFSFDQSTLTLREEYTQEFIHALETGADKLTLADLNEEAANLLALQTAQQLGVQAMSLSNQQTQSVLRLLQ